MGIGEEAAHFRKGQQLGIQDLVTGVWLGPVVGVSEGPRGASQLRTFRGRNCIPGNTQWGSIGKYLYGVCTA